jgi:lactoylglutathione lyase
MTKYKVYFLVAAWALVGVLMIARGQTNQGKSDFSRPVIDVGVVVSDIEKAAKFYTEAMGLADAGGFEVTGQMAGDTGLTDCKPFKVRVFALAIEPDATKLKVMEIPGAGAKTVDNQYICSSLGLSYITVFVSDLDKMMDRLKQHGVVPVKPPYKLSGNNYLILVKDPDGNNIELIGPMQQG